MLWISELMIQNAGFESFDDLCAAVTERAREGERFLRMDIKPTYPDTPDDWEDRLEAAFSGRVD
ncbi:MAG: sulfur relay protein DsrC [Gammaproteobacteria bacterium]